MTPEQYKELKDRDISFIEKAYAATKSLRPQMNIIIETADGSNIIMPVGGIEAYGKEFFYDVIAPAMLLKASRQGKIAYVSIIFEAEMRVPDMINGKPDMKNYKKKPARDVIVLMVETNDTTEAVLFTIEDGKLKMEEDKPDSLSGMMPNVLRRFNEEFKKQL